MGSERSPRKALFTVLLIAVLVLAACGGDTGGEGEADSTDAPATTGVDQAATTSAQAETTSAAADTTSAEAEEEPADGELVEVTFAPTAPLPVYWPYYYIADPLGFYEDEGIAIEFVNAQTAVQQSLLSGRLTFSGTGLDYIP